MLHPNRASVPKEELKEKIAKTYKVGDCVHTHHKARRTGAWSVRAVCDQGLCWVMGAHPLTNNPLLSSADSAWSSASSP